MNPLRSKRDGPVFEGLQKNNGTRPDRILRVLLAEAPPLTTLMRSGATGQGALPCGGAEVEGCHAIGALAQRKECSEGRRDAHVAHVGNRTSRCARNRQVSHAPSNQANAGQTKQPSNPPANWKLACYPTSSHKPNRPLRAAEAVRATEKLRLVRQGGKGLTSENAGVVFNRMWAAGTVCFVNIHLRPQPLEKHPR